MPRAKRPPDPADPELFDQLVRRWWGFCERWAARCERTRPGADYGTAANWALWRAAATFDPGRGRKFYTHLLWQLRSVRSSMARWHSRARRAWGEELSWEPAVYPRPVDDGPDFECRIAPLEERDRLALRLRFAEGLTAEQAGRRLGIGRGRTLLIQKRAISALRASSA